MTNETKRYDYGITVGPIVESLMRTSTPAGLWFVSTMFSDVTRRICAALIKAGVPKEQIVSPFYPAEDAGELPDGVGVYHDRILFTAEEAFYPKLGSLLKEVKESFVQQFISSIAWDGTPEQVSDFLNQYLRLSYICKEQDGDENIIRNLSKLLDALELQSGFLNGVDDAPLVRMLNGDCTKESEFSQNRYIKRSFLMCRDMDKPYAASNAIHPQIQNTASNVIYPQNQKEQDNTNGRKDETQLKTVLDIASRGRAIWDDKGNLKDLPPEKYAHHYALVQADGDSMGKLLGLIPDNKTIREFSKTCISYGIQAASLIGEPGGVTIYAGGDDLLFLAPVDGVLSLCQELSRLFDNVFKKFMKKYSLKPKVSPSLSFGVQICFHRYPLYEALAMSRGLLAKSKEISEQEQGGTNTKQKNRTTVSLLRGSNKEIRFSVRNQSKGMACFLRMLAAYAPCNVSGMQANKLAGMDAYSGWLQSAITAVAAQKAVFLQALRTQEVSLEQVFQNVFHHEVHRGETGELCTFLQDACELMQTIQTDVIHGEILAAYGDAAAQTEPVAETVLATYDAMLRYIKFFHEGADEA